MSTERYSVRVKSRCPEMVTSEARAAEVCRPVEMRGSAEVCRTTDVSRSTTEVCRSTDVAATTDMTPTSCVSAAAHATTASKSAAMAGGEHRSGGCENHGECRDCQCKMIESPVHKSTAPPAARAPGRTAYLLFNSTS
jgi:hypothetical protein